MGPGWLGFGVLQLNFWTVQGKMTDCLSFGAGFSSGGAVFFLWPDWMTVTLRLAMDVERACGFWMRSGSCRWFLSLFFLFFLCFVWVLGLFCVRGVICLW